jgi:2-oxoglutarate ferredoxin oxidoreductase subunit delta
MSPDQLNAKGFHPAELLEVAGRCTGCAICAVVCPDVCITVYREQPVRRGKG